MPESTRRALLASVGASLAVTGCVDDFANSGATDESTSPATADTTTTTDAATVDTTDTTSTTLGWGHAANEFSPDHRIELRNKSDETRTVRVWVVRDATDETVFEETYTLEPGYGPIVYNLRDADPDDVEAFRICTEFAAATTTVSVGSNTTTEHTTTTTADAGNCTLIRTSACYGDVELVVEKNGSLGAIYAIC